MGQRGPAVLTAAVFLAPAVFGAPPEHADLAELKSMSLKALLDVRVVSAARREQRAAESPRSVSVITGREIRRRNYRTVPEALNEMTGVLVQETNYGGGSPFIRGMVGNRILILIDGARLNSSVFRLGPVQYLNTIDVEQVERIEVVRGPGSVLYGSDALGGVINVVTRSPAIDEGTPPLRTRLRTRFSSADRSGVGRLGFQGRAGRFGFLGGASLKQFGDLRAGGGAGPQRHSGYNETDGDLKLAWEPRERHRVEFAASKARLDDVSRSDLLALGSNLRYEWAPQQREMLALRYSARKAAPGIDSLQATVVHQRQFERLFTVASAAPDTGTRAEDLVGSTGILVEMGSRLGERQRLTYGFDSYRERIASRRLQAHLPSGTWAWQRGNYPDGTHAGYSAAYLQHESDWGGRVQLTLGIRYSRDTIDSQQSDPRTGDIPLHSVVDDWTKSAAVSVRLGGGLSLVGQAAEGFRAPNVNDATIIGLTGARFEIPNANLKPEYVVNYETGVRWTHRGLAAQLAAFRSAYSNLIDRAEAAYLGMDWLDVNQNGVREKTEPGIYQRANIGRALVRGVEFEAEAELSRHWSLRANTSWIEGHDRVARTPLSRIPPVMGVAAVRWTPRAGVWAEVYSLAAGRQSRLSPGDKTDHRIPPGGTPGFATWNLRGGVRVPAGGRLTLGLENLADKRYRWHGSGIDAPGRNLVAGVEWIF